MKRKEFERAVKRCPCCKKKPGVTIIKRISEISYLAFTDEKSISYRIECVSCNVASKEAKSSEEALALWNDGNIFQIEEVRKAS